jgi:hypothetical protein
VLNAGAAVAEDAAAAAAAGGELQPYVNAQQQYKLSVPAGWDRKDKAGACSSSTRVLHSIVTSRVTTHRAQPFSEQLLSNEVTKRVLKIVGHCN